MKRTVTELEQRLINHGYKLVSKQYGGKHSQKVVSYTYAKKDEEGDFVELNLDKKREIIKTFLLNGETFEEIHQKYFRVREKIGNITLEIAKPMVDPLKAA